MIIENYFLYTLYSPSQYKKKDGYSQVSGGHVDPHVQGQRGQKGEEVGRFLDGLLEQDPNSYKTSARTY